VPFPGLSLRSNPGLKLANAFGVTGLKLANALGVNSNGSILNSLESLYHSIQTLPEEKVYEFPET
jgi:hypothetical protein